MPSACSEIVDDIEDLIESQELDPRKTSRKGVTVRVKRPKAVKKEVVEDVHEANDQDVPRSIVPGTQKIFIKTWGCTHNNSDGEYMAGLLSTYGYTLTSMLYFFLIISLNNMFKMNLLLLTECF